MKNPVKTYSFWIKILSAALLITLGIWLIIDVNTGDKFSVFIVLMFTGLVAGIFAVVRTIPLMRTLKTGKGRLTCIIEVAVHIALAAAMIFASISNLTDKSSSFASFVYTYYRFWIAFFFYTRVVSYFICVVLCKEETDKAKFWIHIGLMTLTSVICAIQFEGRTIAWIISVLALVCSVVLIGEGGMGYNRYRRAIEREREEKSEDFISEEEDLEIEDPDDDTIIIPYIDEESDDTTHIS